MPNTYDASKDGFSSNAPSASAPARRCVAVTPSDSVNLPAYAKALRIYVPTSIAEATVKITPLDAPDDSSDAVTLKFPSGLTIEPLGVRRVWAAGTTAGIEIHAYLG